MMDNDLLEYWEDVGCTRLDPPDSTPLRAALGFLAQEVDRFAASGVSDGGAAIAAASAELSKWWGAGLAQMNLCGTDWRDVERWLEHFDSARLQARELARLLCLVDAARSIDDAAHWLAGAPGWAGYVTYPGLVPLPSSIWGAADGNWIESGWLNPILKQMRRQAGRQAMSRRWLRAQLIEENAERRGQLIGLLACAWWAANNPAAMPYR